MIVVRRYASLFAALAIIALMLPFTAAPVAADSGASVPTNFRDELVWGGLVQPTGAVFAANGRGFVIQKSGKIVAFSSINATTGTQIADLSSEVDNYWDRGMLGLAIDPGFLTGRPYLYVLYTYDRKITGGTTPLWNDTCPTPPGPTTDGCPVSARLSRLTVSSNGAGNSVTETPLIWDWCQQFPSHSIGTVRFGPEGALYVSGGDGANFNQADDGQFGGTLPAGGPFVTPVNPCGDPPNEGGALRAQDMRSSGDPQTLDGSLIRVDPDTGDAWPTNANAGSSDPNKARIIAYGLRNPFRFTFRSNGDIWIGDVGYSTWEEINEVTDPNAAPRNFGWPCFEGNSTLTAYQNLNLALCNSLGSDQAPVYVYKHSDNVVSGDNCTPGSSAISGITFLSSTSPYPNSYDSGLFFTDYARKCIWFAPSDGSGRPDFSQVSLFANLRRNDGNVAHDGGAVFLGLTPAGEVLYTDYDLGQVRAVRYYAPGVPPTANFSATPTSGVAPLAVHFDASSSTDNSGIASYSWDLNGDGTYGDATGVTLNHTFSAGTYNVGLKVTDIDGNTDTAHTTISSGNSAPSVTMSAPATSLTWVVGQTIDFAATATDLEDGTLPASAFTWTLAVEHCPSNCHQHTVQTFDGVSSGSFAAPDHDYPSWVRLYLTVTDSGGLSTTVQRDIHPKTGTIDVKSSPAGISLGLGDGKGAPPPKVTNIIGHSVQISAPSCGTSGSTAYSFSHWSDGGAAIHGVVTTATAQHLTATYTSSGSSGFTDIGGSKFVCDIIWLKASGITAGCSATKFCPNAAVTRAQMASFLARALHLPVSSRDYFTDDSRNSHQSDINKLAKAGITVGCSATKFCPDQAVTRAQMATFLMKAFHLPAATRDYFSDDNSNSHEAAINSLARSGITGGCAPGKYCPNEVVSRGQMAAFLHRAMT